MVGRGEGRGRGLGVCVTFLPPLIVVFFGWFEKLRGSLGWFFVGLGI